MPPDNPVDSYITSRDNCPLTNVEYRVQKGRDKKVTVLVSSIPTLERSDSVLL